jgi:gliding motility-associated-like protein
MKKFLIIIAFFSLSATVFAQLSNRHWIPPLHARQANLVEDHYLYLSTPIETPFEITVTTGDGIPIQGSPFVISRGNPISVIIGETQPSSMFVNINEVGIPTSKGLILQGTKDFYASFRVRSQNHAEILVSKGKTALGTSFRLGSLPQEYDSTIRNFVTSFMATEDDTSVEISDYDPNIVFLTASGNLSTPIQNFILNKGESIVLAGNSTFIPNLNGFIGALVTSDKPIVINTGNATGGTGPNPGGGISGQDFNLDQIVPIDKVGSEYIVVRGNGSENSEFPLVIATQDNTEIFINGDTNPFAIINAGDYVTIPSFYYQGATSQNMFIESSKPIYLYQILAGTTNDATSGLNFIPPLSCFFQKSVDMIPDINQIGETFYNSDVFVLTTTGANIFINGAVSLATPQSVTGNPNWVTYRIPNLNGNIVVESTGPLAVGVFGYSGAAGFAGYYSGFGSEPEDSETIVCTNSIINLLERIPGNPEPGGTWTVPDGAPALTGNFFDPAINVTGLYTYSFSIICEGEQLDTDISLEVSIEEGPNAGVNSSVSYCTTDVIVDLTSLLGNDITPGGVWKFNGIVRPNGILNPAIDGSGNYSYTIPENTVCEETSATIAVTIVSSPLINIVSPLSTCDDPVPSDTDGETLFSLTIKNEEIVGDQTNVTVKYFLQENDALLNNSNNITSIRAFSNTTIYYTITNELGCFSVGEFQLIVNPVPVIPAEINIKQCDTDTDEITTFNLTEINASLINSPEIYTFTYHNTLAGAQNNTDLVNDDIQFVAANGSSVWVRIINEFGCYRTAKINLEVSTTIIPNNHVFTIEECDNYINNDDIENDGFAYFNFEDTTTIESAVSNLLSFFSNNQQLSVTFYESEIDALIEQNAITNISSYRNTTPNNQIIWARIDSETNNECFGVGPYIELIVNPIPTINLDDFIICVDPITGLGSQIIDATPSAPGNYNYEWNPINPNGNSPLYDVTQEGTYSVVVTNITTGCTNTDSVSANFSSEPAIFSAEVATPAFSSGSTSIVAMASGGFGVYEYSLNLVDWQSSNVFTDLPNGSYVVYVRDIQGCGLLNSGTLFALTYPNFFTPNGDGYHDTWNIANLDPSYEAKIFIYDRYGKLIRQVNPNGEGWDGTFAGQLLPATDYWFRIEYKENGTAKEFKSHFSLIR